MTEQSICTYLVTTADIKTEKNILIDIHSKEPLSCLKNLAFKTKSYAFVIHERNRNLEFLMCVFLSNSTAILSAPDVIT